MSGRGLRRPYARQRRESDEGEEEGFLYCLMYYFDEARRESEDGGDRRRRNRRLCEEEEEDQAAKKKEDEDDEEMLNPLVYRESLTGRSMRGGMMRRAYTPDRDGLARTSAAASMRSSRSHSQPPEINHNNVSRRARKKK